MTESSPADVKPPHPFLYFLLFLPFGATSGFITITVGKLAHDVGLSDQVVAGMVTTNTLPHTWKFLWAPVVDTLWTGRGWYITTNLLSSSAIISLGFIPMTEGTIALLTAIIFINGLSTTFIGMCTESLMAKLTPPEQRGSAGGWSQAGNLGGATLGGAGLLLAENSAYDWMPFVIVGGLLLSCSTVLSMVKEPPAPQPRPRFSSSLVELGRDIHRLLVEPSRARKLPVWALVLPPVFLFALSGSGLLALTLSLVPIGSGGAQNIFPIMGDEWEVRTDLVSITNGFMFGGASIVGSLLGGLVASKVDKRVSYALSGVVLALVAFGMALAPKGQITYIVFVSLYGVALGMCYATFTAFVLDIIGHQGGATKYNLFASLANMPIYAMGLVDGWVATEWDRKTMLWVDGLAGVGGAVLLMIVVYVLRRRAKPPEPVS